MYFSKEIKKTLGIYYIKSHGESYYILPEKEILKGLLNKENE
jgi:hypothetical protein